ncbi:gliding motility-associated peptidyl-prolyl isomerase GldI [Urechidicola croceus]|uniref:Peptidyl-prolyl cis-trans isomerase n=1 Tax=Urechidicola croceus TaxID=1850246 RepID=A0A1D8P5V4_9FLAO|nr:gliding motility-associated peptidyl-prolyl isomerase GldI [Urechidicola croceus]AOW19968.1 gliding motility-associated peptidyl-prolyl isomerase GldI [Urechidicola croceus]
MKNSLYLVFLLLTLISCLEPTPRKPISHKSDTFIEESIERNKKINEIQKSAIEYYIAQDSTNNYFTSENGFWYKYIQQEVEDVEMPKVGDEVIFEYEILDLNDVVIYPKETFGQVNYLIDKEDITSGLQNGLKLMREGEEVQFLFPSFKAFGYTGDQVKIGINQPLIYKVQLLKIK